MQQKETTHKPDQEQALQDLWLKECAEAEELQKIRGTDAFDAFMICFKLRKWNAVRFCEITGLIFFALAHLYLGIAAVVNAAFAHVVLRLLYKKTNFIWNCVIIHFIYNIISLILL